MTNRMQIAFEAEYFSEAERRLARAHAATSALRAATAEGVEPALPREAMHELLSEILEKLDFVRERLAGGIIDDLDESAWPPYLPLRIATRT